MLKKYLFNVVLLISFFLCQCHKKDSSTSTGPLFDSIPIVKPLRPLISEISGIAASRLNPGYLWGIEDSGNPTHLHLIKADGNVSKKIFLEGITNRDWEDIAVSNGEIYIGETGDNSEVFTNYSFYKFAEPSATKDTISAVETINFTYPDGSHDAEAFLIDSSTKNIYIITKRDNPSRLYRLSYPYNQQSVVTLVGSLPYTGVVSATGVGSEIIIKTYTNLFYYKRKPNESIEQCLKRSYTNLPYTLEPQGEAISLASDGSGYYTISEKSFAPAVNLYFYNRK